MRIAAHFTLTAHNHVKDILVDRLGLSGMDQPRQWKAICEWARLAVPKQALKIAHARTSDRHPCPLTVDGGTCVYATVSVMPRTRWAALLGLCSGLIRGRRRVQFLINMIHVGPPGLANLVLSSS